MPFALQKITVKGLHMIDIGGEKKILTCTFIQLLPLSTHPDLSVMCPGASSAPQHSCCWKDEDAKKSVKELSLLLKCRRQTDRRVFGLVLILWDSRFNHRGPIQDSSSSRGPCRVNEWVAAFDDALRRRLLGGIVRRSYNDGVFIHQLAGGVGECRERKRDAVHLSLIHTLLVLLLQVTTAVNKTRRAR